MLLVSQVNSEWCNINCKSSSFGPDNSVHPLNWHMQEIHHKCNLEPIRIVDMKMIDILCQKNLRGNKAL